MQAEMDKTANRWNWNFFKNGWSVKDILSTDQAIKEENKERLMAKWKNEYQWVNNSHKLAILDNGLKYSNISPSQKEMDFVESRRFTRDEILAIFKLPKVIIGIDENSNKASATVAENTFYRVCIRPLARQIAEKLTRDLFNNEIKFEFINIVPKDNEQLLLDLNNWAITINEYRQEIWYDEIKNWNILKVNEFQTIPSEWTKKQEEKSIYSDIIKKTLRKNTKWTEEYKQAREEYWQKKWERKIQRTDKYEIKYIEAVKKIFDIQLSDLSNLQKWVKKVRKPKFNEAKYKTLWTVLLTPIMKEVLLNEWNQALTEIWLSTMFEIWNPNINKYIRDNINRVAKDVDNVTKEKIFDLIEKWNDEWLWANAIANNISSKFEDFKKNRSLAIARTEITNASTQAEIMAWDNSWVVEGKEWFTASDERVCENCWPMNWKTVWLKTDFFKKWEVAPWGLKLDYMNIDGPSLHTNCRCTLLPIIN